MQHLEDLDIQQHDREIEIKGPALKAAFDNNGNPTKAALGWASANGISIDQAQKLKTEKGEWLFIKTVKKGAQTASLVPELFTKALKSLPIPRLMHWGAKKVEFVRPVHSLCMLFGSNLIEGNILDIKSSNIVNGHRFLGAQKVTIKSADSYVEQMWNEGNVMVDYEQRKNDIIKQVREIAQSVNGTPDLDDDLVEEVTSIVEAPYIFKANFEERFLKVPSEALVYTMKGDQKYFPIYNNEGKLLPIFAFVSNINPKDPSSLISGNERVVRPRLSDAEFFFNTDRKYKLEDFYKKLENIVYQKDIGTIAYRTTIVREVAKFLAGKLNADVNLADRAAYLSKCDLASTMVTEFTETQGIMGMHYAELDGENINVSEAIFESYLPRFSGDRLPTKPVQIAVSLAEKFVTLVGIFGINMLPKGDKDPFGLRRAAIGLIRIALENKIELDFTEVVEFTCNLFKDKLLNKETKSQVIDFIYNRLKGYYQDQDIESSIFLSVLSVRPTSLMDFDRRIKAVKTFKTLPAAENLASAYKRTNNILCKAGVIEGTINPSLFKEKQEVSLFNEIEAITPVIEKFYAEGNYSEALSHLSEIKDTVDDFFEHVMVNVEDPAIKINRLLLLKKLATILSNTADISVLY